MKPINVSALAIMGSVVIGAGVLLVSMLVFDLSTVTAVGLAVAAILPLVVIGVVSNQRAWDAQTVQPEPAELEARLAAYRHVRRVGRIVAGVGLVVAALYWLALASWHWASPARFAAFVAIASAAAGWCVVLAYFRYWQRTFRCPKCGNAFGGGRLFARYPHRCRSCEFTIDDAEPAAAPDRGGR